MLLQISTLKFIIQLATALLHTSSPSKPLSKTFVLSGSSTYERQSTYSSEVLILSSSIEEKSYTLVSAGKKLKEGSLSGGSTKWGMQNGNG